MDYTLVTLLKVSNPSPPPPPDVLDPLINKYFTLKI